MCISFAMHVLNYKLFQHTPGARYAGLKYVHMHAISIIVSSTSASL